MICLPKSPFVNIYMLFWPTRILMGGKNKFFFYYSASLPFIKVTTHVTSSSYKQPKEWVHTHTHTQGTSAHTLTGNECTRKHSYRERVHTHSQGTSAHNCFKVLSKMHRATKPGRQYSVSLFEMNWRELTWIDENSLLRSWWCPNKFKFFVWSRLIRKAGHVDLNNCTVIAAWF